MTDTLPAVPGGTPPVSDDDVSVDRGAYVIVLLVVALVASVCGFSVGFISAIATRLP